MTKKERERMKELQRKNAALLKLVFIDPLTGLGNRRAFDAEIKREVARSRRDQHPVALLYIDLNWLKKINDTHGHEVGDRALKAIGRALTASVRQGDSAYRISGDEFAVILHAANTAIAQKIAERIVENLRRRKLRVDGFSVAVEVSIGGATGFGDDMNIVDLKRRTDTNLYGAKAFKEAEAVRVAEEGSEWVPGTCFIVIM